MTVRHVARRRSSARGGMSVAALLAVGLALPVAVHAEEAVPSRDIADVLHDLAGQGVYTRLNYVDAMAANLQGGQRYEVANSGVAMFGADFDLAKLIEMPDAQLHVSFAQLYGRDLASDAIGARLKLQNYSYPHEQFELTSLAYEHGIWNDRLNLLVGRTAATAEFARSTYACQFNSAVDCPMMLTQLVGGLPGFPYVNWGGRLRAELAENISAKVGAYQINPTRQYQTGFDWGTQTSTGYVVPFELGYETSFADDPLPRHYKIGGWVNEAPYTDPYLNTKGKSRALFGGTAAGYAAGRSGGYLLADQWLWKPAAESRRGIAVFGALAQPFDQVETYTQQLTGGVVWTGMLEQRPDDKLGIEVAAMLLSAKEAAYLSDAISKVGGHGREQRHEVLTELNYSIRLLRGVTLQPSISYFRHPDDINNYKVSHPTADAWVVGAKFTFNLGQSMGLPEIPALR